MYHRQEAQLEELKKISSHLEKSWNKRVASNTTLYSNFDLKKLSPTKKQTNKREKLSMQEIRLTALFFRLTKA